MWWVVFRGNNFTRDQFFGKLDEVVVVCIGVIKLTRGEFGVVCQVDA